LSQLQAFSESQREKLLQEISAQNDSGISEQLRTVGFCYCFFRSL